MSQEPSSRRPPAVPDDWDHLDQTADGQVLPPELETKPPGGGDDLSTIPLIACSWGDLAAMLALAAATLVALRLAGHGAPFAATPWALALAVLWWAVTAAVLVAVRRGTPGMLMAGVGFEDAVATRRIPWVLLSALLLAATLGLPSAIGRPGWALRAAARTPVAVAGHEIP